MSNLMQNQDEGKRAVMVSVLLEEAAEAGADFMYYHPWACIFAGLCGGILALVWS